MSHFPTRHEPAHPVPADLPQMSHGKRDAASVLDLLGADDPLRREVEHLLEEGPGQRPSLRGAAPVAAPHRPALLGGEDEVAHLHAENAQMRTRVEELEQILEATTNQTEQMWAEQQREYEALLEEKSEVIRNLHQQLQELREARERGGPGRAAPGERPENLSAARQELMALREELEEQRRQLEEDEQALMQQMTQMEMAMSKERVELARQRNEVLRMKQDLQHEIEAASRDGSLRERLAALQQQRHQDGPGHPAGATPPVGPAPRRALPTQVALDLNQASNGLKPSHQSSSGTFRRLFGGK